MKNIKLIIAYDGSNYLGWQKTKEGPSIEAALQKCAEQICQHPIYVQAASRTDAGVHAEGQVVNFLTSREPLEIERLTISLNALLPLDIRACNAEQMPPSFHPTLDCIGKEYGYDICYGRTQKPFNRLYSWHYPYNLDLDLMEKAVGYFIGERDFSTFCNDRKGAPYEHGIRRIDQIEIMQLEESRLSIRVVGNHFLYKMVRNLVGTLIYIGRGKISISDLPSIIDSQDRTQAGVTAPAHGLFLRRVFYGA